MLCDPFKATVLALPLKAAAAVLLLTAGAGCQSPPPPPQPMADPIWGVQYPKVVVEPGLQRVIVQAQPTVTRTEYTNMLRVVVPVRTVRREDVRLQYRVFFFDAAGAEENPNVPWRDLVLTGMTRRVIDQSSLRSETVNWRLEIRRKR